MKKVVIQTPEGTIDQAKEIARKKVFTPLDIDEIILLRKKNGKKQKRRF